MKGVQNIDEIRIGARYDTTIGVTAALNRRGDILTIDISDTPQVSATIGQVILDTNISDIVGDDNYFSRDFVGGRYATSGTGSGIIVIRIEIIDGMLTLTAKTAINPASAIAFQAVVMI